MEVRETFYDKVGVSLLGTILKCDAVLFHAATLKAVFAVDADFHSVQGSICYAFAIINFSY